MVWQWNGLPSGLEAAWPWRPQVGHERGVRFHCETGLGGRGGGGVYTKNDCGFDGVPRALDTRSKADGRGWPIQN